MAGQIKELIDQIVLSRSKGNATIASTTMTKICLKGINANIYTKTSTDDPDVINRLRQIALELGVSIN